MEEKMNFFLNSSRGAASNFTFTLQFTVSHGPPSKIVCKYNGTIFIGERHSRQASLGRKVIRSHYINSSYPDMTSVSVTHTSPREPRIYTCTVTVEGRVNIHNDSYDFDPMGSGTTTVSITGEFVTVCCTQLNCSVLVLLLLLSQLQPLPLMSLPTGLVTTVLVSPGLLLHQQEHHQLAMRCFIS